jgi:hypothetical protein
MSGWRLTALMNAMLAYWQLIWGKKSILNNSSKTGWLNKLTKVQMHSSNSLFYTISYHSTGKPWLTNSLTNMADCSHQ